MAKRGFIKSIIKTSPFKKLSTTFISLVLLFILSIVLHFIFKKYTVETFIPKDDARIEVMLWTDDFGSINNKFVSNEWMDIVNSYDKFATFGKGDLADYKKYVQNVFKGTPTEPHTTDANLEHAKQFLPFVTVCLFVDNKLNQDQKPGFYFGTMLTTANIKSNISRHLSKDYKKLYSNAMFSTPTEAQSAYAQ